MVKEMQRLYKGCVDLLERNQRKKLIKFWNELFPVKHSILWMCADLDSSSFLVLTAPFECFEATSGLTIHSELLMESGLFTSARGLTMHSDLLMVPEVFKATLGLTVHSNLWIESWMLETSLGFIVYPELSRVLESVRTFFGPMVHSKSFTESGLTVALGTVISGHLPARTFLSLTYNRK